MDWTWGPADTWQATRQFLQDLASSLPEKPRALLVVSGHWEESAFTAGAAAAPRLIYDYSGFPVHTYQLTWPAPGDPALAERVASMLKEAELPSGLSPDRGYDHGVFVPLKVAFPLADIPVVTLSLATSSSGAFDPAMHVAAGRALASLRDEGVLIIGSGMSFHNLGAYFGPETPKASRAFDAWLTRSVELPGAERDAEFANWQSAPYARFSHPREEHLVPLFVTAGAGGDAPGVRVFHDEPMGAAISAYRFDG
jgi:aromatic ring-opening dioxygenase catalytic subunit (LigB family)